MGKDFDEMYRLGLYGNGIERIKLKKAVQIIQKASASQVKIVDIGHDNFDSACEALELGSVIWQLLTWHSLSGWKRMMRIFLMGLLFRVF